jgi:hypothetical protein
MAATGAAVIPDLPFFKSRETRLRGLNFQSARRTLWRKALFKTTGPGAVCGVNYDQLTSKLFNFSRFVCQSGMTRLSNS